MCRSCMSAIKYLSESPFALDHLDSAGAISVLSNFVGAKPVPSRGQRSNELLEDLVDLAQVSAVLAF